MGNSQSKSLSELSIGPCKLRVIKGFIQNRKEEAIVNTTSEDLDFEKNPSAKALAAAAGPGLKDECRKFGKLVHGEVRHSNAYKLLCKKVLHLWIGQLDNKTLDEKEFVRIITDCLRVVDQELKLKSVAFPALGTGVLQFPADFIARCFIQSLKRFFTYNIVSNLRDVCIVIFQDNTSMYEIFTRVFGAQGECGHLHFMDRLVGSIQGLELLDQKSEEFFEVEASFGKSLGIAVTVLEITRVQNYSQWVLYKERRRHIAKSLNKPDHDVEHQLYHGTSADTALEIAEHGFSRNYAGKNATAYGRGSYFARSASYSHKDVYSKPDSAGEKTIIRARVIVGLFAKGASTLTDAPKNDSDRKYDSVVDDVQNPSIFVVFHDAAAYPEYIIKYKT